MVSSPCTAGFSMRCMKPITPMTSPTENPRGRSRKRWGNTTPMGTAQSMMLWCAWRRTSQCLWCCWTGKAILAPWMAIRPRPIATQKCVWKNRRKRSWPISTKIQLIFSSIMMAKIRSPQFCRPAIPICWSTALAALPWAWPPISPPTTWAKWLMRHWP